MGVIDEKALEAAMIAYRTADYDRAHAPGPLPDVSVSVSAAITAYLSAFPPRELLREALEALTFVVETRDCNHLTASDTFRDYYAQSCPICRARAAADKIRAALTQEDKT